MNRRAAQAIKSAAVAAALLLTLPAGAVDLIDRRDSGTSTRANRSVTPAATTGHTSPEALVELLGQIDALQNEVKELRNQVEVQSHELRRLKDQQRNVSRDMDQRLIRLERSGVAATPPADAAGPAAAPVAPTPPAGAVTPVTPRNYNKAELQKAYESAFKLMKDGLYSRADTAFRAFLEKYPGSSYADNAQYWLAEANYHMRKFTVALPEFDKVLSQYPDSPKVADAMLKKGYTYYELGDFTNARKVLTEVVQRFPNTRVAKLAGYRLSKIQKTGPK